MAHRRRPHGRNPARITGTQQKRRHAAAGDGHPPAIRRNNTPNIHPNDIHTNSAGVRPAQRGTPLHRHHAGNRHPRPAHRGCGERHADRRQTLRRSHVRLVRCRPLPAAHRRVRPDDRKHGIPHGRRAYRDGLHRGPSGTGNRNGPDRPLPAADVPPLPDKRNGTRPADLNAARPPDLAR